MNLIKHTLLILTLFVSSQLKAKEPETKKDAISFDYNFSGATPVTVETISDYSYRIKPVTKISGSQFFYLSFRINNLRPDREQ